MKKINKKGFLLAEAIIVGVFVLSLFTFLFVNVVPLVGQYEAYEKYDSINGAYNANMIRAMIMEDANFEKIVMLNAQPYRVYEKEDLCNADVMEKPNYCMKLLGETYLNVNKIYVTWYRSAQIKEASKDNSLDFDRAAREYIENLPDYDQPAGSTYDQAKRLIIYYNDGTFANVEIKVPENPGCVGCTDDEVSCVLTAEGTRKDNNWYISNKVDIIMSTTGNVESYGLSTSNTPTYNTKYREELTANTKGITYYGYVKDVDGFTAECKITVKKSNTYPEITKVYNPTNGQATNQPFSLELEGKDEFSGIDYWYYSYDQTNWVPYDGFTLGDEYQEEYDSHEDTKFMTSPFSKDRQQYVYIKVCNKAGLCSTTPQKTYIWILTKEPTCTLTHSSTVAKYNDWYKGDVTLSLTPEPAGGVNKMTITTSSTRPATLGSDATLVHTQDTTGVTYYGYIEDVAGNKGMCTATEFKKDTTAPNKPTITNPTNGNPTNSPFSLTVSSDDTTSGINYWYYSYNQTNWTAYDGYTVSSNYQEVYDSKGDKTFVTSPFSTPRNESVYIKVCDNANNCSAVSSTTINISVIKPVCQIDLSGTEGNSGWYRSSVTATLNITGQGSGSPTYKLTTSTTPAYDGTSYTATQNDDTSGKTYYGYVKDSAGNTNSCSTTIKKDIGAPYARYPGETKYTVDLSTGRRLSFEATMPTGATKWIAKYEIYSNSMSVYACTSKSGNSFTFDNSNLKNLFNDSYSGVSYQYQSTNDGGCSGKSGNCTQTYTYYIYDVAGNAKNYTVNWIVSYNSELCKQSIGTGG